MFDFSLLRFGGVNGSWWFGLLDVERDWWQGSLLAFGWDGYRVRFDLLWLAQAIGTWRGTRCE